MRRAVYTRDRRGEAAKVGDVAWPGEPIAEIPAADEVQAEVYVLEADAGGLVPRQKATVVVEARPNMKIGASAGCPPSCSR